MIQNFVQYAKNTLYIINAAITIIIDLFWDTTDTKWEDEESNWN